MRDLVIGLAPLVLLVTVAVAAVWRGLGRKGDDTANRAKGGGAKWRYWE